MEFRYSEWRDDLIRQNMKFDDLMKLFTQLLLHTNGDVDEALHWMTELDKQFHMFSEEMGFDDFVRRLKEEGLIADRSEEGTVVLTPKGEKRIRQDSLDEIFNSLKKSPTGLHDTPHTGKGIERLSETRKYQFGDPPSNIDFVSTIRNAMRRSPDEDIRLEEEDFEVYETEHVTSCATVLAIDISHSMILYGEDRITPAKKVAMALTELIQTRYPKDSLDVITFGDDAQVIDVEDIPYLQVGPYHTNTKEGLRLARQLLRKRRNRNKQVFMITDGKPSCMWVEGRLYKNPYGLDRRIVNQTLNEAIQCRKEQVTISTFMITDDPYLAQFIENLTQANKGRAFYSSLNNLGQYILVDYLRNRRKSL